jgi:hypothetical protein
MKSFLTIMLAFVFLLSGMHFTIASHYCGGKIAATKVSVSGKMASCGMEAEENNGTSSQPVLTSHCCDNKSAVYSTDNVYSPSEFHFKQVTVNKVLHHFIPAHFIFHDNRFTTLNTVNTGPPGYYIANAVRMTAICVFRI